MSILVNVQTMLLSLMAIFFCSHAVLAQTPSPAESMAEFCNKLPRPEYADLARIESPNDWFELYQVAEGVTAIYEPYQWQEVISYLIEGDDQALLFDTGNGIADIAALVVGLTDKPISIINSHSHYDHVGGNHAFEKIYAMDTPFTRAREAGHDNGVIGIEVSKQALCRPLPTGVTEKNHVGRPYKVSNFIRDGFEIDLGNRRLEVMHVPGHTPDAIVLLDRNAGLMWTGDSYYSGPIWLFAPETDLDAFEQSVQKLANEAPNLIALLPAHNVPIVEPSVLLRLDNALSELRAGKLKGKKLGDGMVSFEVPNESTFSFLLREGLINGGE